MLTKNTFYSVKAPTVWWLTLDWYYMLLYKRHDPDQFEKKDLTIYLEGSFWVNVYEAFLRTVVASQAWCLNFLLKSFLITS